MLVLRGEELLSKYARYKRLKDVQRETGASYPTVHKYTRRPESTRQIDAVYLASFLTAGIGLTVEEAEKLTIGEVFRFMDLQEIQDRLHEYEGTADEEEDDS